LLLPIVVDHYHQHTIVPHREGDDVGPGLRSISAKSPTAILRYQHRISHRGGEQLRRDVPLPSLDGRSPELSPALIDALGEHDAPGGVDQKQLIELVDAKPPRLDPR
jgi:hypothetical protein